MKDLRKPTKLAWQDSEESLQKACAEFLKKLLKRFDIEQELFFHVPNEGLHKPQYRAKMKLLGVRSGVSDIHLMLRTTEFSGLICELKKAGGSPSPEQKAYLEAVSKQGFLAVVINDFDTFVDVFSFYIKNRNEQ